MSTTNLVVKNRGPYGRSYQHIVRTRHDTLDQQDGDADTDDEDDTGNEEVGYEKQPFHLFLDVKIHDAAEMRKRFPAYATQWHLVRKGLDSPHAIECHLYNNRRKSKAAS